MGGLTQAKPNHKWFFTQIGGDDLEIDWGTSDPGAGLVLLLVIVLAILPLVMLIEVIRLVRPKRGEGGVTREYQQGNSTDTDYSVNDR